MTVEDIEQLVQHIRKEYETTDDQEYKCCLGDLAVGLMRIVISELINKDRSLT